ncbi:MAG TPA: hypothetical protein VGC29_10305 [Flavisolibacter sp.]
MKMMVLLCLVWLGCATPNLTSSWVDPGRVNSQFRKIAVVAIIHNEDSGMRKKMEDHLVKDLRAYGYEAVSFSRTFDPGQFPEDIRYDTAQARLLRTGVEAIITISLLDKQQQEVFVKEPYNIPVKDKRSFWGYYKDVIDQLDKGNYTNSTNYYWEAQVFDLLQSDMIYRSTSAFFDENSKSTMAHRYGKAIMADMKKQMVLGSKRPT